jgi:hypothetical protein
MAKVLTDIQELTPLWLEERLGQTTELRGNHVAAIEIVNTRKTNISSAYFLRIRYTDSTNHERRDLPERLFLKIPHEGQAWGTKEVDFYQVLVPCMADAFPGRLSPFIHCLDAAHSATLNRSHLLLEDLSQTHFTNPAKVPPTRALCDAVIDAYASFHAFWWEHPWLGERVGEYLTDRTIDDFIRSAEGKLAALLDLAGDALTAERRRALAAVAAAWPARRRARVIAGKGVTLVHRDPHPLNFLYPHDPVLDTVKLIDWESWRVDTGTDDLAYLMAFHWSLAEHPGLEMEMLVRYYERIAAEVEGYSWEDLLYDYRASIIRCLFFMLIAWSPQHWAGGIWWERVQQGLAAYERLACSELLE